MNVLSVMDEAAADMLCDCGFPNCSRMRAHAAMTEARDAVAELIEADKELQFIRNNGCAAETYEAATARHDTALARVQGDAA